MAYCNDKAAVQTERFTPLLHIIYALEAEFGCEGVPEDGEICGSIIAEDEAGRRTLPIAETLLFRNRLADDTWIGLADGVPTLLDRKKRLLPLDDAERRWWETHR